MASVHYIVLAWVDHSFVVENCQQELVPTHVLVLLGVYHQPGKLLYMIDTYTANNTLFQTE